MEKMNLKQKLCVSVGVLVAIIVLLNPPVYVMVGNFRFILGENGQDPVTSITTFMNIYELINESYYKSINWKLFTIELVSINVVTLLLVYLFKDSLQRK